MYVMNKDDNSDKTFGPCTPALAKLPPSLQSPLDFCTD